MANGSLRVGVITDIHYGNGNSAKEQNDLYTCFDFWQKNRADFAVQLGDLIDGKGAKAEEHLKGATAVLREYPGTLHHVLGNHCLGASLEHCLEETGLASPYYTFSIRGMRFIVLHGMDINPDSTPESGADKARKNLLNHDPWANLYCGAVGEEQLHWLVGQLDDTKVRGESAVIFCHFPLLKETSDEPHGLLWNHDEVTGVLRRYDNIIACFTGHLHRKAYFERYGIHFMTFPAFVKRFDPPHYTCGIIDIGEQSLIVQDQNLNTIHELPISG